MTGVKERALADDSFQLVEGLVDELKPEVAHPDFISVGIDQADLDLT